MEMTIKQFLSTIHETPFLLNWDNEAADLLYSIRNLEHAVEYRGLPCVEQLAAMPCAGVKFRMISKLFVKLVPYADARFCRVHLN